MGFPAIVPDVPIYAGDSATFPGYRVKDHTGAPIDLSTWSDWKVRWRNAANTSGAELSIDATQLAAGWIVVRATATQTRAMDYDGVFDVSSQEAGETRTWVRGRTILTKDVDG